MKEGYISKQQAIDELFSSDCAYAAADIVKKMPGVDVAPVVHAHWDDSFDGITPYCSACGMSHRCLIRTPDYCPNCGAKMDEEGKQ